MPDDSNLTIATVIAGAAVIIGLILLQLMTYRRIYIRLFSYQPKVLDAYFRYASNVEQLLPIQTLNGPAGPIIFAGRDLISEDPEQQKKVSLP
jgi:hypothetical protein